MKEETYIYDPLNEQASVLVNAQTDIKTAIKQAVLSGFGRVEVRKKVAEIIDRAIARIRSPTLKEDGRISLMRFADRAYTKFVTQLQTMTPAVLTAVVVLIQAITSAPRNEDVYKAKTVMERRAMETLATSQGLQYSAYSKGLPLQEFQKKYMDRVDVALEELAKSYALDPNDFSGRNSLRNLAEMQVRYDRHQEEIQGFKDRNVKLVVCSVHADCSDRCKDWQGGVYSLDGTEGYTEDGRHFQPLENATDIYYTTKAGRTYKNGLLGFNCRHKLYEYKAGMVIPSVSADERNREYATTQRQRAMERAVISAREIALSLKGVSITTYRKWKSIAKKRMDAYKRFSKENGRAYYPDRVKIL